MASYEDYADAMRFRRRVVDMDTHSIGIEVRHHLRLMGVYSADPELVAFHDGMARIGDKLTGSRITDDNWPFSVSMFVMDTLFKVCKAAGKHASPVFQHVPGDNRTETLSGALAVRVTDDVRMLCVPSRMTGDTLGTELFRGWRSMSDVAAEVKPAVSAA